jgi:gamma-glutamyltranspeptidase/glutathione hydrolase
MLNSAIGTRGIVSASHNLAAQAGLGVLREGGNAIEAAIAAAAAIAVVYPHMNALGGDGFWLIAEPGGGVIGVDACGAAGERVDAAYYAQAGMEAIPARGAPAANTVAGTVSGWAKALEISRRWGGVLPLSRLLEDAIHWAQAGFAPSASQIAATAQKLVELRPVHGFIESFAPGARPPAAHERFRQPRLAATLALLAAHGPDSFYRGPLARMIAADLARAGSPLTSDDLARHEARVVAPLVVELGNAAVYNLPPPTQGLATLLTLGLFERLQADVASEFDYVHALVECTKQAFLVRDACVTDPAYMNVDPGGYLASQWLDARAARIDRQKALAWPHAGPDSDTVWLGAIDAHGRAVSFIQSIYWEFGCGVVLQDSGILWQNRGCSFELRPGSRQELRPGRKPFHTLNPSAARFRDGRTMVFGAMGGEGQPQTQAAVFTRYARLGMPLQGAVSAPRWLLGRTWGAESTSLKLESRFDRELAERLRDAGHRVEIIGAYDDLAGHAGALVRTADGLLEGAADPRGNGCAAAY